MLRFEIDAQQVHALIAELGVTEKQAKFALGRALQRTAATLRRMSERGLKSALDIKKVAYLRKRLKSVRFRGGSFQGMKLWYGLNDMPVSALRGAVSKERDGARFAGKAGAKSFKGGFPAKSARGFGRTILMRQSKARLPLREAEMPVKDRMDVFVEDHIFVQAEEIFWKHFERDMTARSKFGVGATKYRNEK